MSLICISRGRKLNSSERTFFKLSEVDSLLLVVVDRPDSSPESGDVMEFESLGSPWAAEKSSDCGLRMSTFSLLALMLAESFLSAVDSVLPASRLSFFAAPRESCCVKAC